MRCTLWPLKHPDDSRLDDGPRRRGRLEKVKMVRLRHNLDVNAVTGCSRQSRIVEYRQGCSATSQRARRRDRISQRTYDVLLWDPEGKQSQRGCLAHVVRHGAGITSEQAGQRGLVAEQASVDPTRIDYSVVQKGVEDH